MIKPLTNYIVLEPYQEQKKKSAILLPEDSNEKKTEKGKVIAVGENKGAVKKGDVVLFKKYSEQKVSHDGKDYLIVKAEDVLAVIN